MEKVELFIVCVHYGNDEYYLKNKIKKLIGNKSDINIILVDTSKCIKISESRFISQNKLNQFYEFTGYKYGLVKVDEIKKIKKTRILFINDTIFKMYSFLLYKYLAHSIFFKDFEASTIRGILQKRQNYQIVPTCFFILDIDNSSKNFYFIPKDLERFNYSDIENSIDKLFVGNKKNFEEHLELWLNPKYFLKGWYKSCPNKKLSKEEYSRKKLTIYLEHSMLKNNISFKVINFEDTLNKKILNILKLHDFIKRMFFKIYNRIRCYLV